MGKTYEGERARLDPAFDAVKSAEHWKGPIDATLTTEQVEAVGGLSTIKEAITFYTATEPSFEHGIGNVRVKADGYWGGPAA